MPFEAVTFALQEIGLGRAFRWGRRHCADRRAGRLAAQDAQMQTYRHNWRYAPETWEDLIEEVVVCETWFFRDKTSSLGEHVMPRWIKTGAGPRQAGLGS